MFDLKTYPQIEGKAKIASHNNNVVKGFGKLKPKLHQGLFSAVQHAVATQDTTLVTALWNGLGGEVNKGKGIATWLNTYTNLMLREGGDGLKQWLKPKKDKVVTFKLEGIETPFYDMDAVNDANEKVPDFDKSILALIGKYTKLVKEGKVDAAIGEKLQAVRGALHIPMPANA